ncbi:protein eva-1 homolog C isoform X3 [Pseudopipra pipra]|uniref:protein eva-1 homolog C isoform X3 n=1 Tax=Pseudopipra pipra TaxID=415032 RepID=UPI003139F4A3
MRAQGSARRGTAGIPRPFPAAPASRPDPLPRAGPLRPHHPPPPPPSPPPPAGRGSPEGARRAGGAAPPARTGPRHVSLRGCPPAPRRPLPHHEVRGCGAAATPRSGRARAAPPPPLLPGPRLRRGGRGARRLLRLPNQAPAEPHSLCLRWGAPEPALSAALNHQCSVSILRARLPHVQHSGASNEDGRTEKLCGTHLFADCLSYTALEVLSKRCSGKQRCKIIVSSQDFGSPCLPGVTKSLTVSYACVPKFILMAVNPGVPDNKSSIKQNDGVDFDPKESRLPKKDGIILSSNYLAAFAYIRDHLERAALLFVSSICVGLILTLCALVICGWCPSDIRKLHRKEEQLVPESARVYENSEQEEEENSLLDTQDEIDGLYRPSYSGYNLAEAAELAERIERREQIIQEIWMNSGVDMTPPRNMNTFYINEQ